MSCCPAESTKGFSSLTAETKAEERLAARTPYVEPRTRAAEALLQGITEDVVQRLRNGTLPEFAPSVVRNEVQRNREEVREYLRETYEQVGRRFAAETQSRLEERTGQEAPQDADDQWTEALGDLFVAGVVAGIVFAILSQLQSNILAVITVAQDDGLGISGIASRLERRMGPKNKQQAALVARTAITTASNRADLFAAKRFPATLRKQWVDSDDDRVRLSHEVVDGNESNLGEPFVWFSPNSGRRVRAQYPGDPQLPLPDLLNCRCIMIFIPV